MLRSLFVLPLIVTLVACGSSPTTPSAPPPSAAPTNIIRVFGSMAFGDVGLGQNVVNKLTIANDGTAPLNYTGITVTGGVAAVLAASPQSGQVPPGGVLDVSVRFTPAAAQSYAGTFVIDSDATSGTGTIAFSGRGTLDGVPIFRQTGSGNTVFDVPRHVTRLRIIGSYPANSSNFIVRYNGSLVVNELVGTSWNMPRYEGVHLVASGGGTMAITSSSGVAWSFEEVR